MKLLFILLFLTFFIQEKNSNSKTTQQQYPFYSGKTIEKTIVVSNDSLKLICDTLNTPLFYSREIFTEICEAKICFPVQLTIFWDYSGSFLGYAVPEQFPLTKTGHKPFSKGEYFQLYMLLNYPDSKLGKMDKTELVKHNSLPDNKTDAVSSATVHVSGETLVSGAAFTCFTLWQKVNREKEFDVAEINESYNLNRWKEEMKDIQHISPDKLALLLKLADKNRMLRKFSVQQMLTEKIDSLTPLKSLIINNYLNRQKYIYPEVKQKLTQCENIERCFARMVSGVK